MRYKDIKVGMTVARKGWGIPYVVVSTTQHLSSRRLYRPGDLTTIQVTSDKGELVTTSAHFVDNPSGTPRKVVAARRSRLGGEEKWYVEEMALSSIAGPYDEVREAEARKAAAHRKNEADAAARRKVAQERAEAAIAKLAEAGFLSPTKFRRVGAAGAVELSITELEALAEALA